LLAASLLAASALLATLFFPLALLAFAFLLLAISLLLAALLPRTTRFAWLLWIVLFFHLLPFVIYNFGLDLFAICD
jgi:putative exporter of polyketide antibiotics